MHWFAIVFSALRVLLAAPADVPGDALFDRVPPEDLWVLRNR